MNDWDAMWDKPFAGTDAERLTIDQRIAQVKADVISQLRILERRVDTGAMKAEDAARELECMMAVLDALQREKHG